MSRWLLFEEWQYLPHEAYRKTLRWHVMKKSGGLLGMIEWYPRWRQYVFYPQANTLYNEECLSDIRVFLVDHRNDRRKP